MKKIKSFRLSDWSLSDLQKVSSRLGVTETEVIEEGISLLSQLMWSVDETKNCDPSSLGTALNVALQPILKRFQS